MRHQISVPFVLAAAAATAQADIVDMYATGPGRGVEVRLQMGHEKVTTFAGQLLHQADSATGVGERLLGEHAYYSTEPFDHPATSPTTFTISTLAEAPSSRPMGAARAAAVESLFAFANGRQFEEDAPAAFAGAFQLALWEVVADYEADDGAESLDVFEGQFRVAEREHPQLSRDVLAHLGDMFDAVGPAERFSGSVVALRGDHHQDMLQAVMSDRAVPAPASSAALGAGLILLAARRRR